MRSLPDTLVLGSEVWWEVCCGFTVFLGCEEAIGDAIRSGRYPRIRASDVMESLEPHGLSDMVQHYSVMMVRGGQTF